LNQINVNNNQNELLELLQSESFNFYLNKNFLSSYYEKFKKLRNEYSECSTEITQHEWLCTRTINDKYNFYFNLNDQKSFTWTKPESYKSSTKLLTYKIISVSFFFFFFVFDHFLTLEFPLQDEINQTTEENERFILYQQNEQLIVTVQAQIRGYLSRKSIRERLTFFESHVEETIKIQVCFNVVFISTYKRGIEFGYSVRPSVRGVAAKRCVVKG
jgi:hypothetical protein